MARPRRTRSRPWLVGALAMTGWLVMGAFAFAAQVEAKSCGLISVNSGSVSPTGGTTGTTFTFSVTVSDRTGAKPASVTVRVLGAFTTMTTTDTNVRAGLVYRVSMPAPVGSWSYWFRAQSSRGILCDLTLVDPATITITAPTPKPTPSPTPSVTPKPTPIPRMTPRPTPKPAQATPRPSAPSRPMPDASLGPGPTQTGQPAATTTLAPATPPGSGPSASEPSSADTTSPTPVEAPSSTPGPVAAPVTVGSVDGGDGGSSFDAGDLGPGTIGPLSIWLMTTVGGLWLFLLFVRRPADGDAHEGLLLVPSSAAVATVRVAVPPAVDTTPLRPTGRATMLPQVPPRTFDRPPAKGIERARIGYRRVRISSKPDGVRSVERGRLERGDEVEILDSYEGYLEIRTPDGITGWILRHTIIG
jgi:hypothetical protein